MCVLPPGTTTAGLHQAHGEQVGPKKSMAGHVSGGSQSWLSAGPPLSGTPLLVSGVGLVPRR